MAEGRALVVLLVGPSGCGKSHLARSSALPVVSLDDFYLGSAHPAAAATAGASGEVDWEDPVTWDALGALRALEALCASATAAVEVPDYSLAASERVGVKLVERRGASVVVAEGLFAAELISPLGDLGLLADALLLRQPRAVTFVRRFARDLREGRKGVWHLVAQGWSKARAEPAVVARQVSLGARPVRKAEARRRLDQLAMVVGRVGIEPTTRGL